MNRAIPAPHALGQTYVKEATDGGLVLLMATELLNFVTIWSNSRTRTAGRFWGTTEAQLNANFVDLDFTFEPLAPIGMGRVTDPPPGSIIRHSGGLLLSTNGERYIILRRHDSWREALVPGVRLGHRMGTIGGQIVDCDFDLRDLPFVENPPPLVVNGTRR